MKKIPSCWTISYCRFSVPANAGTPFVTRTAEDFAIQAPDYSRRDDAAQARPGAHQPVCGRLKLLSAAERRYCEPLLAGFAARHPGVDVDFVFGISTDLHRRFVEEARSGGATADLFWNSAMDQQMGLVRDGYAQPHGVSHSLPRAASFKDLAVATTCEPVVTLSRDPSARAGTPAEIAALIASDPKRFRGRIAIPDIESNGLGFLAMLRWSQQPGFEAFLDALASCAPRAVGSAPALVAAVIEGAELALHLLGSYALRTVAAEPALHIAPSASPSLAVSRVAFIPRGAANPDAAAAFLAYLLSPEGQAAIGEAGLFPITHRPAQPVAPIPIDDGFVDLLDTTKRASMLARWRAALGRTNT